MLLRDPIIAVKATTDGLARPTSGNVNDRAKTNKLTRDAEMSTENPLAGRRFKRRRRTGDEQQALCQGHVYREFNGLARHAIAFCK
jgi:hypothetical protein